MWATYHPLLNTDPRSLVGSTSTAQSLAIAQERRQRSHTLAIGIAVHGHEAVLDLRDRIEPKAILDTSFASHIATRNNRQSRAGLWQDS